MRTRLVWVGLLGFKLRPMATVRVLYIEDEPKVAAPVKKWLEENDFTVELASDGAVGQFLVENNTYDLVLLDLDLPFVNGYELCKGIRISQPNLPVIMATALGSVEQKLRGFELGADDYIVKPFDFRELLARMRALIKRNHQQPYTNNNHQLHLADLEIDFEEHRVRRNGQSIALTSKEFTLLEFLARKNGKVASRQEIIQHVWDIHFDTGTNVVEVYINFLRKKIDRNFEPKLIHTKPGMGYYLNIEPT